MHLSDLLVSALIEIILTNLPFPSLYLYLCSKPIRQSSRFFGIPGWDNSFRLVMARHPGNPRINLPNHDASLYLYSFPLITIITMAIISHVTYLVGKQQSICGWLLLWLFARLTHYRIIWKIRRARYSVEENAWDTKNIKFSSTMEGLCAISFYLYIFP